MWVTIMIQLILTRILQGFDWSTLVGVEYESQ